MLVLSRKPGESITVFKDGQKIATMSIIEISGRKAKLGVEADPEIKILRNELIDKKETIQT